MRMSRRLALYSTNLAKTVVCTFLGAVGETLTFRQDGKTIATATENTAIELQQGVYAVTGSISGYTKQITVTDPGTYKAYPGGAVYWYGRELATLTQVGVNGEAKLTRNTNHLLITSVGWSTNNATFTSTEEAVDFTGYNTCKIVACPVQSSTETSPIVANRYLGVNSTLTASYTADLTLQQNFSSTEKTEYSFDIASLSSGYPGIRTNDYYGGYQRERCVNLYAIWLEGDNEPEEIPDAPTPDEPSGVETLSGTNSIDVTTGTYRYTTENTAFT